MTLISSFSLAMPYFFINLLIQVVLALKQLSRVLRCDSSFSFKAHRVRSALSTASPRRIASLYCRCRRESNSSYRSSIGLRGREVCREAIINETLINQTMQAPTYLSLRCFILLLLFRKNLCSVLKMSHPRGYRSKIRQDSHWVNFRFCCKAPVNKTISRDCLSSRNRRLVQFQNATVNLCVYLLASRG